jgi:hypothetical protein
VLIEEQDESNSSESQRKVFAEFGSETSLNCSRVHTDYNVLSKARVFLLDVMRQTQVPYN